jgi:hypothetical protein
VGLVAVVLGLDLTVDHPHRSPAAGAGIGTGRAVGEHAGVGPLGVALEHLVQRQVLLDAATTAATALAAAACPTTATRARAAAVARRALARRPPRVALEQLGRRGESLATGAAGGGAQSWRSDPDRVVPNTFFVYCPG